MFQMKMNIIGKDLGNFMTYGNSPKELNGYKTDIYIYIYIYIYINLHIHALLYLLHNLDTK